MKNFKEEEQHILTRKLKNIDESLQSIKKKSTYSYETGSNKQDKINNYEGAKNKPYFGRIDVNDENGETETLYIGEVGIEKEDSEIIVVDWRADIAQLFYSFHGGINKLTYESNGQNYNVIVERKRQIGIENQQVVNVIETVGISEKAQEDPVSKSKKEINRKTKDEPDQVVIYQDDFINKILSQKNDNHQLKNIIVSIQMEQDEVIRQGIDKNIIVQGASGSGKSSIALYRISYLLYKYKEQLKPHDILILAPNKMFLSLIQESFPQLNISGIKQSTFIEWAKEKFTAVKVNLMEPYETLAQLINQNYQGLEDLDEIASFKGSILFKNIIDRYLNEIEFHQLPKEKKVTINADDFIDTQRIYEFFGSKQHLPLNQRIAEVRKFIEKEISVSEKNSIKVIEGQFDLIYDKWINELPDGSSERKSLFSQIDLIKETKLRRTIKDHQTVKQRLLHKIKPYTSISIYKELLNIDNLRALDPELKISFVEKLLKSELNEQQIPAEDVASLIYIDTRLNGVRDKISYLIVDEAQDLSALEVEVLKLHSKSMTLLGDITQSIYSYKSIEKWEELIPSVFADNEVLRMNLEISYRSTYEIMSIANTIVMNSEISLPIITPVKRNGDKPVFLKIENGRELFDNVRSSISNFREKGYKIIGIIGKDLEQTTLLHEFLIKYGEKSLQLITDSAQKLTAQIVLIPSYLVKGLEFDAVIIPNAGKDRFSNNVIDTKLLYVCVTRAHHDLHVYYHGELSPLLKKKELLLEA